VSATHDLWLAWSWEPVTVVGIGLAGALYGRGVRRIWGEAGRGRVVARRQVWCFALGLAALALALLSPLDALGEELFAAHMVKHRLLILVAAPLIVFVAPLLPMFWAFDRPVRRAIGRWWHGATALRAAVGVLTMPVVAWSLHVLAIWARHLPGLYQAALGSELVHALEHASFFGTALLFWWVVFAPSGRRRLAYGPALFYVLAAGLQGAALGAILTFAHAAWYPAQSAAAPWGFTPLEDQQLAGIIMWVPSSFVYLGAASYMVVEWLRTEPPEPADRGTGWTGY
jgi:cytochrome c oxidase assembly factor CtaG